MTFFENIQKLLKVKEEGFMVMCKDVKLCSADGLVLWFRIRRMITRVGDTLNCGSKGY